MWCSFASANQNLINWSICVENGILQHKDKLSTVSTWKNLVAIRSGLQILMYTFPLAASEIYFEEYSLFEVFGE